jgi:hypothetical protein
MRIARQWGAIPIGRVLRVPEDIDEATAQSWLRSGLAEEDTMLDGPPEVKSEPKVALPKFKRRKKWPIL